MSGFGKRAQVEKVDFWGWLSRLLILLAVITFVVVLFDRFTGNGEAWSFYAAEIDMTCVVGKEAGKRALFCVEGDHRVAEDGKRG